MLDLINSVEGSLLEKLTVLSADQEIPRFLTNLELHYRPRKSQPTVLILSRMDLVNTVPLYFYKIHFNIIL